MNTGECFIEIPACSGCVLIGHIDQIGELLEGVLTGPVVLQIGEGFTVGLEEFVVLLGDQWACIGATSLLNKSQG